MRHRAALLVGWFSVFLAAGPIRAHGLAPSLLELRETAGGTVDVRWKTSALTLPGVRLEPVLPSECRQLGVPAVTFEETMTIQQWTVECRGLVGRTIAVRGLDASKTEALLRVELADGRRVRGLLRPREPSFVVPAREPSARVAADYFGLGVEHILLGFDHLLFILGLLLLVRKRRRLIATITAFTVGHSVPLALVTLGYTRFSSALAETAIAASILVLAIELSRPAAGRESLMRRYPWVAGSAFGLLHGLGFAGALAELGLPQGDIPLALFSFNVGIEAGQIVFVIVALALARKLRDGFGQPPAWSLQVPVYVMGTLAAFWTFERLAQLF